jgi:hypothetical protein
MARRMARIIRRSDFKRHIRLRIPPGVLAG